MSKEIQKLTQLGEILTKLGKLALKLEFFDIHKKAVELLDQLRNQKIRVLFLGSYNNGKSSLINSILELPDFLPVGVMPTTKIITEIVYSTEPQVKILDQNENEYWINLEEYNNISSDNNIRIAKIFSPKIIFDNLTIIDTPGISDPDNYNADIMFSEIPNSDIIFFVLDASKLLTLHEKIFLKEKIIKNNYSKLIAVINKVDLLKDEDISEYKERLKLFFASIPTNPSIIIHSDQKKFEKENDSLTNFHSILMKGTRIYQLDRIANQTIKLIELFESVYNERCQIAEIEKSKINSTIYDLERQKGIFFEKLELITIENEKSLKHLSQSFIEDFNIFSKRLIDNLPNEISLVPEVNEVSKFIPFYIESNLKAFLEVGLDKILDLFSKGLGLLSEEMSDKLNDVILSEAVYPINYITLVPERNRNITAAGKLSSKLELWGSWSGYLSMNRFSSIFYGLSGLIRKYSDRDESLTRQEIIVSSQKLAEDSSKVVVTQLENNFAKLVNSLNVELRSLYKEKYDNLIDELERVKSKQPSNISIINMSQTIKEIEQLYTQLEIIFLE